MSVLLHASDSEAVICDRLHGRARCSHDANGKFATDEIRVVSGSRVERERAEREQDNALEAWPEHWLPGTQPGPNKDGKKW